MHLARVGVRQADDDLQNGGLADTISADQRNSAPGSSRNDTSRNSVRAPWGFRNLGNGQHGVRQVSSPPQMAVSCRRDEVPPNFPAMSNPTAPPAEAPGQFTLADARQALLVDRRKLTKAEVGLLAACPWKHPRTRPEPLTQVRLEWCGDTGSKSMDLSVSGRPEDCQFCSQSSAFDTDVKATPFLDTEEVLAAARETEGLGHRVLFGVGDQRTGREDDGCLLELTDMIESQTSLNVAISAGTR